MTKRLSNIELLKIISLLLITIQHVLTSSNINFGVPTNDFELIIYNCFRYCGYIGNTLFIICSAYFLIDSKKSNKEKIVHMIADSFVISIIWLIPFIFLDTKLSSKDLSMEFLPIIYNNNWFIGCYIFIYLVHPILNKIINLLSKKQLLRINIFSFIIFFIIQFILKAFFYFNCLLFFILIYFIVAYLKKYMNNLNNNKKVNLIVFFISTILYFAITITTNYLGLYNIAYQDDILYWSNNLANPFCLMMCISLFNLFNMKQFHNETINKISSLSLIYYLIHENILFRTYIRPNIYLSIFNKLDSHFLTITILISIVFILGIILSFIYKKTIQKMVHKISTAIFNYLKKIYLIVEESILKLE